MTNNVGNLLTMNNPTAPVKRSSPWNPHGKTNWVHQRLSGPGQNIFPPIGPNTGVVIRVPMPRRIIERKVAALLNISAGNAPTWKQSRWAKPMQPILENGTLKVWCADALSYPGRTDEKAEDLADE